MSGMITLEKLQRRWLRKTGEPMPESILRLPIDSIAFAVRQIEAGQTVFVPSCPVAAERVADEIREWDGESNN